MIICSEGMILQQDPFVLQNASKHYYENAILSKGVWVNIIKK